MPTMKELQARRTRADRLLAGNLSGADRLKVAKLRLLDEAGIMLRQKVPDFDARMAKKDPPPPHREPKT
jgi:hypothetical protein